MTGYKKILMPHDGSEMSDKALEHAAYIAKISGADLVILNVIETEIMPPSFTLAFRARKFFRSSEGKIEKQDGGRGKAKGATKQGNCWKRC